MSDRRDIPPPQMTPQPYTSDRQVEPTTNPGLKLTAEQLAQLRALDPSNPGVAATPAYVKRKVEAVAKRLDDEASFTDGLLSKIKALGGLLVAVVAVTASVLVGLDTRAQGKADTVEAAALKRDAKQDAEIKALQEESQRKALSDVRVVLMLEQLTEKARLPVPPVILPDGGR